MSRRSRRDSRDFVLDALPPDCVPTRWGNGKGADAQYRGPAGLHVRRYGQRYLAHYDWIDPRDNLVGHLFRDCRGAISAAVAATIGTIVGVRNRRPVTGIGVGTAAFFACLLLETLMNDRYECVTEPEGE